MAGVVCAISSGVSACSGVGLERAFACATGALGDAFSKSTLFESPRYADRLFGIAQQYKRSAKKPRCRQMLFDAIGEALAKIDLSKIEKSRISIFFGTSIGGIFEAENMLEKNLASPDMADWSRLRDYECSTIAEEAAKHFGFGGETATYSTACSSSSLALSDACNALSCGDCDVAVVCGADALSRITVNGFGCLLLLSRGRAKPFDANRDGINLGEAAAALILANEEAAKKSAPEILAYASGWACTADAYHATAPRPDGAQAARAISRALSMAKIAPGDVGFYLGHGTATKGNDAAEFEALKKVFGANIPPYASIKHAFGHTLGASGILNAVLAIEALRKNQTIPNLGFEDAGGQFDPACCTAAREANIKNIVSVSLGFGGNNSAAVFTKEPAVAQKFSAENIYVYAFGEVNPCESGSCMAEASRLLEDVPALRKRRLAKLQQMGLECVGRALRENALKASGDEVAVCWGTGCAMMNETARFVEATITKKEAEPIPSAFTNSVHNAVASAISQKYAFTGLNGTLTEKEISFEAALKEAVREINSGGAAAAVVGAADEFNEYAQKYLNVNERFAKSEAPLAEYACAYTIGKPRSAERPLAEILCVEISRRKRAEEEAAILEKTLKKHGVNPWEISAYTSFPKNKFTEKFLSDIFAKTGIAGAKDMQQICGRSYSASAGALKAAVMDGAKYALSYSLSSAGMRAFCLFKIL